MKGKLSLYLVISLSTLYISFLLWMFSKTTLMQLAKAYPSVAVKCIRVAKGINRDFFPTQLHYGRRVRKGILKPLSLPPL